jgi:hypothetical protein
VKKVFADLLHRYKVEAFKISHNGESVEEITRQMLGFTEQALNNAYHYHFHDEKERTPERIEIFNLIKKFTLEALMPPVVEKVTRRMVTLERQHEALVRLLGDLLEALSSETEKDKGVRVG